MSYKNSKDGKCSPLDKKEKESSEHAMTMRKLHCYKDLKYLNIHLSYTAYEDRLDMALKTSSKGKTTNHKDKN